MYAAKNATRVAANLAERKMGRPPLVRDTSRWAWNRELVGMFGARENSKIMDKIVLQEDLAERLNWTTNSLVSTTSFLVVLSLYCILI